MSRILTPKDRFHFVGIGGIGMSGLARIVSRMSAGVTGSDMHRSQITDALQDEGIEVSLGHCRENLPVLAKAVVRSAAVPDHNPEIQAAVDRGLEVLRYSELLGRVMDDCHGIAVAGTHGKTTTTAMISHVLMESGLDPTYLVGGNLHGGRGNARSGGGEHFITEACEYAESFLDLRPRTAIITNIEEDHLDYYGSLRTIRRAFESFISSIPSDGLLILNADDHEAMTVAVNAATCRIKTFAVEAGGSVRAVNLRDRRGRYTFDLLAEGRRERIRLNVPGRHNVYNALATAAAALEAGVSLKDLSRTLSGFEGVKRRFEVIGNVSNTTVISDYAHHPTEIKAALSCTRRTMPHRRIFCVFQPHQGSRTRFLMDDFAQAFIQADVVILPDIYYVRDSEEEFMRTTSEDLLREIKAFGTQAVHLPAFEEVVAYLKANVRRGDVIMAMGAGTIENLPEKILEMLRVKFGTRRVAQARRRFLPKTFEQIRKKVMRRSVEPVLVERLVYAT